MTFLLDGVDRCGPASSVLFTAQRKRTLATCGMNHEALNHERSFDCYTPAHKSTHE